MGKEQQQRNLNVRVPVDELDAFYSKCEEQGHVGADVIRQLMRAFVQDQIQFIMKQVRR